MLAKSWVKVEGGWRDPEQLRLQEERVQAIAEAGRKAESPAGILVIRTGRAPLIGAEPPDALPLSDPLFQGEGCYAEARAQDKEGWQRHHDRYIELLRRSYREHCIGWDALLTRSSVRILCGTCRPRAPYCNRRILAEVLVAVAAHHGLRAHYEAEE